MKIPRKFLVPILVLLLIAASVTLFMVKMDKDKLQKQMDQTYTNAIMDSMAGLGIDYSKLEPSEQARYYYQTITNLKDAIDIYQYTSYEKYDGLFETFLRLYSYWIQNGNADYILNDRLKSYEFLGKVLVFPDDKEAISKFNRFLDDKTYKTVKDLIEN